MKMHMVCASALLTASALLLPAASASAAGGPAVSPSKPTTPSSSPATPPASPDDFLITDWTPPTPGFMFPGFPAIGLESRIGKLPIPDKKDSVGQTKDLRAKACHYFAERKWITTRKGGFWLKAGTFEASVEKFPPGYRFTKIKKTITGRFVYGYGFWEPARYIDPGSGVETFYQDERTDLWVLADNFVHYHPSGVS